MPLITVIVTTYNLGAYLEEFLQDLQNQVFQDFEVVFVDDCSTDATCGLIRDYFRRYPEKGRAVFLDRNQGSPARTRNIAQDACVMRGEYTVFLDGDDRLEPTFLRDLLATARMNDADVAICAYDRVETETGKVLSTEMRRFPQVVEMGGATELPAFINSALWNKLFRSSVLTDCRVPDFRVGEDLCFAVSIYMNCRRLAFTDKVLIHYRVRRGSVIANTDEAAIRRFARELAEMARNGPSAESRELIALMALIHIGISMALRAADNPAIPIGRHLAWTRQYLAESHDVFGPVRSLSLRALMRYGVRGWAVWTCKMFYRARLFRAFLFLYRWMMRLTRREFKF